MLINNILFKSRMRLVASFGFLRYLLYTAIAVSKLGAADMSVEHKPLLSPSVTLLSSGQEFCEWRFVPGEPLLQEDDSLHPTSRIMIWEGASIRQTSSVAQPVRSFFVAVPPGAEPELTVLGRWSSPRSFGLPPATQESAELSPLLAAPTLSGVSRWRDFRLAQIDVPLSFGDTRSTSVLDSVHVRIDFRHADGSQAPTARDTDMLPLVALNGNQATRWWQHKPQRRTALDGRLDSWPEIPLYRLSVQESGLYLLTGASLRSRGVNFLGQPSSSIKLFGNGGRLLDSIPGNDTTSSLIENSIAVLDGGDGRFDEQDSIIFYGAAPKGYDYCRASYLNGWAHQSPFFEETAYFIGVDPGAAPGLRMESIPTSGAGQEVAQTTAYDYVDNDEFIRHPGFQESGLVWYMSTLAAGESRTFTISLPNVVALSDTLRLRLDYVDGSPSYDVFFGDSLVYRGGSTAPTIILSAAAFQQTSAGRIRIVNNSSAATLFLNWIELESTRRLTLVSNQLLFNAPPTSDTYTYSPAGLTAASFILDITNPLRPRLARGNTITDPSTAGQPRRYFALTPERLRTPTVRGLVQRTATDYTFLRDVNNAATLIILTYDDWYDDLAPLRDFHETYREEPLTTVRVKIGDVFDEFGWGNRDPVAIRNFLKYAFEFWHGPDGTAHSPKYVIFVGDGDYDYRNLVTSDDDNWMPPWESGQSCYDAFYCRFTSSSPLPELISGRLPVRSAGELENVINKTMSYANTPLYGSWKATATFAADDEWKSACCNEYFHMDDSERLMSNVLPEYFTFKKIYESLYPFRVTAQGRFKPDAGRDLIEEINRGTLLVNFAGHGNAHIWTDELMFVMDRDNTQLDNDRKWPLFIAGTCTWGQYDAALSRCFPEVMLVDQQDGCIASIAATRFTGVGQNQRLVDRFYTDIFRQGIETRSSFGEAMLAAHGGNGGNDLYHVLGDPVLRLASPEYFARLTSPNDSLQALSIYQISGEISRTEDGPVWDTFNGIVEARVFDTEDSAAYDWADCSCAPIPGAFYYGLPGNAIFRGQASIANGRFDLRFRVPRDIRFGGSNAKISLYFYGKDSLSADSADGIGIRDHLLIADEAAVAFDSIAPAIQAWLEVPSFRSGDLVSALPKLHIDLADSSGINLSGEVGHRITARLDDAQTEDLTPFFNYNLNSFTIGSLEKSLGPLTVGPHTLSIEAWDSFNNLNQIDVSFVVGEQGEGGYEIHDVLNWPNPMRDETYFTYFLTQSGTKNVEIKIYTLTGKLLYELKNLDTNGPAFNSNSDRPWDGRDRNGHQLANGVYLYKVNALHENGHKAEATGKLVILR